MGTRQQGGGIGSSRPPAEAPKEYQEFTPVSAWREAGQSRLLMVYLSDFGKEQLRVTKEGTDTLRISGERQIEVSGNKWSRFQKDFRIPEDCNVQGIHARLDRGILNVTFPYKTTQLPSHPPRELESKTTTQPPPQPPPKEQKPKTTTTKQTPPPPPTPPPPRRSQKDIRDQQSADKTLTPAKSQPKTTLPPPKEYPPTPPPSPRRSQKDIRDQQSADKTLTPAKSQPNTTLPPPKEDQITPTTTITTPKGTSVSSRGGQTQPPDGSIENERRGEESADDQRQKGNESLTRDEHESVVKEIAKKEEERGGTATATATATASGEEADGGWFKTEKHIKVLAAVKRLAQTHLDHNNRKLLANMGVAALITLAFGAYIYYALKPSLNPSEES